MSYMTEDEDELRETASSLGEKVCVCGLAGPAAAVAVCTAVLGGAIMGGAPTTDGGWPMGAGTGAKNCVPGAEGADMPVPVPMVWGGPIVVRDTAGGGGGRL